MDSSYIDDRGYARFCNSGELVHHLVAERKLGRRLKPWEVVHHRNRNKLDNRPINIYIARSGARQLIVRSDLEQSGGYVLGI